MQTLEHWIGGRRTAGSAMRSTPVFDPATGRQRGEVLLGASGDVDLAVASATKAFAGWSQTSVSKRAKVLFAFRELVHAHADELARAIVDEHGKVFADALGEVQRGLEVVEFACGIPSLLKGDYSDQVSAGVDTWSYREPLGVVAGITPFNFPVMVPMWMHPVAIACGNSFVLKPSERDPSPSLLVAELWQRAGLPDGVFSVVQGDREVVDALLGHPGISAVSFVGSTPVARHVHERATAAGKRVQALGGAKNHAVVMADADVDVAAEQLATAAFGSAGERCMAISAAVVVGPDAQALVAAVSERARRIRVGDGHEPSSDMGPVISREAHERIVGLVTSGVAQGAHADVDGRGLQVATGPEGFFVGPTVLSGVTPDMEVYREEVFGPVLVVLRVDTLDEAIALINSNPYGNGTAIFTTSGESARTFQRGVHVGMVGVNVPVPVPMAFYSFGGWKASLFGDTHVHGAEGISFCTRAKVVTSRWPGTAQALPASYSFPTSA